MSIFDINPDIAHARTLSTDFYTDPRHYAISKEKIFASTWQFIGDTDELSAGSVKPVTFLEHYINEPLVVSKDKEGTLRCLSNVCTHRGNLLIEKPCKLNDIRCKYHGRRFHLDGKFLSMPEFKEVIEFPTKVDDLTVLPLHRWGKWLFTSLGAQLPAEDFLSEMSARVNWMPLEKFVFRADLSRDYKVEANWALYCENFLEGFHIPFVHAGLNQVIDYGNYAVELYPYSSLQLGISKDGNDTFDIPPGTPDFGKKVAGYYFWVFPNMMFNFYPWGLSINIIRPTGQSQCLISFLSYVWDESKLQKGAGGELHRVELEDEDVVQNVQKGIRSRFYKYGRYSVTREQGTHHFHKLISQFMK